jgi:hypothetical protein
MALGITKGIANWKSQQQTVERYTDNAAYTSAHPDDTLVLAGPPRWIDSDQSRDNASNTGSATLLAIGMVQGFQFSSQKPTQPLQAIGSGRLYFVSGKSQTTWRVGRLFCNGRNLLRVLNHNIVSAGIPVQEFDDTPVANDQTDMYYINLDSELYHVPFGLAAVFRTKMKDLIGAVYLELCMIQTYGIGFNAGQTMVMEDVNGLCDRALPFRVSGIMDRTIERQTIDEVIGFIGGADNLPSDGTGVTDDDAIPTV